MTNEANGGAPIGEIAPEAAGEATPEADGLVGLMSPEFAAATEETLMASFMAAAVRTKHALEDVGTSDSRLRGLVDDHLRDVDKRAHAESMDSFKAEGVAFVEGWEEQATSISKRAIDRVMGALFPRERADSAPSSPNA